MLGLSIAGLVLVSQYSEMLYGRVRCSRNPRDRLLPTQHAAPVMPYLPGTAVPPSDDDGEIAAVTAMNADIVLRIFRVQNRMFFLSVACIAMYVAAIEGDTGVAQMVRYHPSKNVLK
jgi:hypothetical protein